MGEHYSMAARLAVFVALALALAVLCWVVAVLYR